MRIKGFAVLRVSDGHRPEFVDWVLARDEAEALDVARCRYWVRAGQRIEVVSNWWSDW